MSTYVESKYVEEPIMCSKIYGLYIDSVPDTLGDLIENIREAFINQITYTYRHSDLSAQPKYTPEPVVTKISIYGRKYLCMDENEYWVQIEVFTTYHSEVLDNSLYITLPNNRSTCQHKIYRHSGWFGDIRGCFLFEQELFAKDGESAYSLLYHEINENSTYIDIRHNYVLFPTVEKVFERQNMSKPTKSANKLAQST